jgi:hypothetical protein
MISVDIDIPFANAIQKIQRWSDEKPEGISLLHKRKGRWKAFRWRDVLREVERLIDGPRHHGFADGVRLAVSGAYEPDLIFVSLAAYAARGQVYPVARNVRAEELNRLLTVIRPTHAFVQSRRDISRWLASAPSGDANIQLFSSQSIARRSGNWEIVHLQALRGTSPEINRTADLKKYLKHSEIAWVDEGTEWRDGLKLLLDRWLIQGAGLAFPETSESAARDRQEIQPTMLLSSQARREKLEKEIQSRLAPQGSWTRKLCDLGIAEPDHAVARLINARQNEVLGLRRLDLPEGGRLKIANA